MQPDIICHDWSNGPATDELRLTPSTGRLFAFGESKLRAETEPALSAVRAFVARFR